MARLMIDDSVFEALDGVIEEQILQCLDKYNVFCLPIIIIIIIIIPYIQNEPIQNNFTTMLPLLFIPTCWVEYKLMSPSKINKIK